MTIGSLCPQISLWRALNFQTVSELQVVYNFEILLNSPFKTTLFSNDTYHAESDYSIIFIHGLLDLPCAFCNNQ